MSKQTGRLILSSVPKPLIPVDPHNNKAGILIYSDINNTEAIWVGYADTLTANQNDAEDGFPIFPGGTLEVEVANPTQLFIRSTTNNNQKAWFIML